jgi:hypothetical protein
MSNLQFKPGKSDPPAKSAGIFSNVFLFLFGLPFLAVGVFGIEQAISKIVEGKARDALLPGLLGPIFACAGLGVMFLAVSTRKKTKRDAEIRTLHPDQPWLLREDWAVGRIKSSVSAQVKIYSFVALMFCGIGAMYAFAALPKELHKGNFKALIVLVFPAIGIGFMIAVVRAMLARRRFGDCFFELAQVPIPLGGTLEGMIQTGARIRLEHGLHLKLSCIRRTVSGSGKNRSVQETILWQDEKVFKSEVDLPEPEPGHSGIPVFFKLPADQPECFARGNEAIIWRLAAKAKMAGPDFSATFDVPVFKVAGAAAEADEPDPTTSLQMPVEELRRDEHSKIEVTDGPNGREFYFPAARNTGTALLTTLLMLIFNGIAAVTFHVHAPILFPIAFGLFGILLLCGTFSLWFKSSRVTIDSSGVRAVNRWLFFSRTRRFAASDVARFATKAGMQSGSQVFLDIKLITQAGNDSFEAEKVKYQQTGQMPPLKFRAFDPSGVTLASSIASQPEAAWLVQEMTKALARKP